MQNYGVDLQSTKEKQRVPAFISPECPTRLFTIKEAAEALRIPSSWLYERTRRNAIPYRRIGKYVRFTQDDLNLIISSGGQSKKQTASGA
jgi:excisionase family DNA binding protein